MYNKKNIKALLGCCALLTLGAAHAGQTDSNTGSLAVSATISPECAVAQKTAISITKLTMLDTSNAKPDTTTDDVKAGALYAICTNGTQTPQFRFQSANAASAFKMLGDDATTTIDYTLWEGTTGSGTSIGANSDAAFSGFTADGTQQTLNLSIRVAASAKNGKPIQGYSDTITITTSYGP